MYSFKPHVKRCVFVFVRCEVDRQSATGYAGRLNIAPLRALEFKYFKNGSETASRRGVLCLTVSLSFDNFVANFLFSMKAKDEIVFLPVTMCGLLTVLTISMAQPWIFPDERNFFGLTGDHPGRPVEWSASDWKLQDLSHSSALKVFIDCWAALDRNRHSRLLCWPE